MFLNFVAILLEPLAYFLFAVALFLRKNRDNQLKVKVLFAYYVIAAVSFGYANWLVHKNQNNNWIYNMSLLPAFLAMCYYFHQTLYSQGKKAVVKLLVAVNVIYFFVSIRHSGYWDIIDSIGYAVLSITISFLAFVYFYQLLKNVNEYNVWTNFDFWLVSSYLLYFLGSFFIFLLFSHLTSTILNTYTLEQRRTLTVLWSVHNVLLFLSSVTTLVSTIWIISRSRF
jgi:hypothetical protein